MSEEIRFLIDGKEQLIPVWLMDRLKEYGVIVDEKHIIELNSLYGGDANRSFMNLTKEYGNLVLFDPVRGLGKIVGYSNGERRTFVDLCEALAWADPKSYLSFEKFDRGTPLEPVDYDFFGCKVKYKKWNPYLVEFSYFCQEVRSSKLDDSESSKRAYRRYKKENPKTSITYEQYLIQPQQRWAYWLGQRMIAVQRSLNRSRNQNIPGFSEALMFLFKRYSYKGIPLFKKVTNLKDYKDIPGIYVLCLEKESKYYIGKASVSLQKRILEHFRSSKSDFDSSHNYCDITGIYVLPLNRDLVESAEEDCISCVQPTFLANSLAGGRWILGVHDKEYNPDDHRLTKKGLDIILKNSVEHQN